MVRRGVEGDCTDHVVFKSVLEVLLQDSITARVAIGEA